MPKLLEAQIERLKQQILTIGLEVEKSVSLAVKSLQDRNSDVARQVVDGDIKIDQMEVDLEEECLKILALYQPVAVDLRFIIAVLKINNDLERIGDLAANIAMRSAFLAEQQKIEIPAAFYSMFNKVQSMVRRSLTALVNSETDTAYEVCHDDDEVDDLKREVYNLVKETLVESTSRVECELQFLLISRHLERIADLATNIAEDVIYLHTGEIVRHRVGENTKQDSPPKN
jgi:phosphate transport system protein